MQSMSNIAVNALLVLNRHKCLALNITIIQLRDGRLHLFLDRTCCFNVNEKSFMINAIVLFSSCTAYPFVILL